MHFTTNSFFLFWEKILFNVALILFGQHCTGKNFVQCCPRGFRQHCAVKILFNVASILFGQHCTGKNLLQCCPRSYRQKILLNAVLKLLEQHCTGKMFCTVLSMLPKKLQAKLHKKNFVQCCLHTLGTTLRS